MLHGTKENVGEVGGGPSLHEVGSYDESESEQNRTVKENADIQQSLRLWQMPGSSGLPSSGPEVEDTSSASF